MEAHGSKVSLTAHFNYALVKSAPLLAVGNVKGRHVRNSNYSEAGSTALLHCLEPVHAIDNENRNLAINQH